MCMQNETQGCDLSVERAGQKARHLSSAFANRSAVESKRGNESAWGSVVAVGLQVYYDLIKGRKEKGMEGQIAIVRIEQLAPFPFDLVMRELRRYPNAEIMWCVFPA